MRTRQFDLNLGLLTCTLILSSCVGLPPISLEAETIDLPLGPQITSEEHQTRVFESLWGLLEANYIYYEHANVNWDELHETYLQRVNSGLTTEEFNALLNQFESELPENEFIFRSRAERIEDDIADNSSYGGIGAFVGFEQEERPHIVILDVMPDSPAEQAGLLAHDTILAVDGDPVRLEEGLSVVDRIRGPADSKVLLKVKTPGENERDVEITRAQLTGLGGLKSEQFEDTHIGYVLFPPSVPASLIDEFTQILTDFSSDDDFRGVILDLRISNSSAGWPLEAMLSLFQNGIVGEIYSRTESQILRLEGRDAGGSQELPLVILTGENTRGLPEIFTAAMQQNGRATVIGSATPGDVETLGGFLLPDGSQVFIASTSFRLPDGEEIGVNGISPAIQIDARWDQIGPDKDPLIQAAIEALEVQQ